MHYMPVHGSDLTPFEVINTTSIQQLLYSGCSYNLFTTHRNSVKNVKSLSKKNLEVFFKPCRIGTHLKALAA